MEREGGGFTGAEGVVVGGIGGGRVRSEESGEEVGSGSPREREERESSEGDMGWAGTRGEAAEGAGWVPKKVVASSRRSMMRPESQAGRGTPEM